MKTQKSFEIMTYIKGHVYLNMYGVQTYNELCQLHRTSAVIKTLVFRWHKKYQDGFTNHKDPVPVSTKLLLPMLILLLWQA